ncbi:MAG: accessory factor UbiK family protein [Rickettsiales bacterium]
MQKDNKFFEDIAKIASGAAGSVMEMKNEMEAMVSAHLEKALQNMDLATKEECDALRGMVAKLREEQEELKNRLEALEKQKSP